MKKGFIFSLDAIIAALLATILLSAIVLSSNSAEVERSPVLTLRQNAEDALAAMDKQGVIANAFSQTDAAARASLYSFLNASIPTHLGANITVEVFEYQASGSCSAGCQLDGNAPSNYFCTCKRVSNNTASVCSAQLPCKYVSQAKRMNYQYFSGKDRLALATLEVWVKGD